MRVLIFILTYVVSSMASSISSPSITTEYATYPSFVVTSSPLPACPSNALCAHTVCIEEVHVLGTKTVTEVTTVVSTLIKPVTSWSTITSTVTVPGKDCTVTSHRVTSKYDTATVSLTETSFVTIDSVVYATKTVIETVSQLCEAATGPTLPISTGDPIPVTSDGPQPIVTGGPDSSAAQSSVTIVEWEADYVTAWTVASLALSTQIPLPIPRTATVDENPNPGRVTLPQCAREGKLTYSFLQGYGWDNVDFNKPSDPITDFTFGPISFKAMNWKYLDKPNIIEQGTHPVLEAIAGQGAFTLVNPAEAAKLQQFAIELPENAELVGVSLQFAFHVSHTTGDPFTWNFNMDGGSYGKSLSPSWTFTNLGIDLSDLPQNSWPALMTLTRTDTGAFVPFHLRQVLLCEG